MRIAVVSQHFCIRGTQSGLAAQKFGHEVHLFLHPESALRQLNERFETVSTWFTRDQLMKELRQLKPDIIHTQDRPHFLTVDLIEEGLGIPIVQDVHDMDSLLSMPLGPPLAEAKSIIAADGLVFVSDECRAYAERWLAPLPPSVVVHSTVCNSLMPTERMPHVGGAVWNGGLYPEPPNSPRYYINQLEIVQSLNAQGEAVFIHPAPNCYPENAPPYANAGAIVGAPLPYVPLLQHLTRYDYGWYGQTENNAQIHSTLPNKLFDYIGAGLPVLVINAKAAAKFVTENKLGIAIDRPEDLRLVKKDLLEMRESIWKLRHEFTREQSIQPLLKLYERLAGKPDAKEKQSHETSQSELRVGGHGQPVACDEHHFFDPFVVG